MSSFDEKLRLKGQAEEDSYFARRDRELIEGLHRKRSAAPSPVREGMDGLPKKVVSGGQTGVDRAALDAALRLGIDIGGWCPRGRRAEDGPISERYPLLETPSRAYRQRTEWNVRDSDATLIMCRREIRGGTRLTAEIAARYGRPLLALDLAGESKLRAVRVWLRENGVGTLNVAGPREESAPGIYAEAYVSLCGILSGSNEPSPQRTD
jgi:hypothetical protein